MGKRKETVLIEEMLAADTREKRIYGCEEVTIGFCHNGHGDERVDYMTMDSKDILKCYEIKVTVGDLKSDARKSFYGHYNYLAITIDLYNQIVKRNVCLQDFGIPDYVGIIVCDTEWYEKSGRYSFNSMRRAKKQQLKEEDISWIKSSLIRTLYWKMDKYRTICDKKTFDELKKQNQKFEKLYNEASGMCNMMQFNIRHMKYRIKKRYGIKPEVYHDSKEEEWEEELVNFTETVVYKALIEYEMKLQGASEKDLQLLDMQTVKNFMQQHMEPKDAAWVLLQ